MPELPPASQLPPQEKEYNVAEAQAFLESVGQFDQDNVHPNLAQNLLSLNGVWHYIDSMLTADPSNDIGAVAERVYSGFTERGKYFEVYGERLHLENKTIHTGRIAFQADLATGEVAALLPDVYIGPDAAFLQLRFGLGAPGLPLAPQRPSESDEKNAPGGEEELKDKVKPDAQNDLDKKEAPLEEEKMDLGIAGHPYLQISTEEDMPPEDFFYSAYKYNVTGRRRFYLVDTAVYQEHTGLYLEKPRTAIYVPDPPFTAK